MKQLIRGAIRAMGFDVVRYRPPSVGPNLPADLASNDRAVLERISDYTMTGVTRQLALVSAVRYLVHRRIEGCMVECGVWRGGSTMAMALTLQQENATERDLYLFDTFEGMTPPTDVDKTANGVMAQTVLEIHSSYRCIADIEDVQANMDSTGYPESRVHLIKGPVEKTIPEQAPAAPIALLRLDTDWYESTRHELVHLFPRLVEGGILIIDDYGHWTGSRKAVDEYFGGLPQAYYLNCMDYSGRLVMKV